MRPGALDGVATAAEKLQIADMIRSAFHSRDDVIDVKMLRFKMRSAPVAVAALFTIEELLVLGAVVFWDSSQVRALRDVCSVSDACVEQSQIFSHSLPDQFVRHFGYVNSNPFSSLVLSRDTGCRASAKWIEDYIALV